MMTAQPSTTWKMVPLGEVATIQRTGIAPEQIKSGTVYVGLENIASGGTFVGVGPVSNGELASTKFSFTAKHVLYGKLRPYLAKISCPDFDGVCSTDILPILPGKNVDRRYLCYFLRQPHMVEFATSRCSGANLPRLSPQTLAEFQIPLPPLSEQRRIADILDKADAIRQKRREAVEEFDSLRPAIFSEMFSAKISTGEWSALDDYLVELRYGTSNKSSETGYPTLRIPNIVRGIIDVEDLKYVAVSENEFEKLRLVDGDILFVRTNGNPDYVGRCSIFECDQISDAGLEPDEVIFASYLIRARLVSAKLRPAFLQAYLQTPAGRRNIRDKCRTSAGQYNINTKGIGGLRIPEVAISDQEEFEGRVAYLKPHRHRLTESSTLADEAFQSLVKRAFRGEL